LENDHTTYAAKTLQLRDYFANLGGVPLRDTGKISEVPVNISELILGVNSLSLVSLLVDWLGFWLYGVYKSSNCHGIAEETRAHDRGVVNGHDVLFYFREEKLHIW